MNFSSASPEPVHPHPEDIPQSGGSEPAPVPGAAPLPGSVDEEMLQERFNQEVFFPWQEQCMHADHPWRATPELRRSWLHLAQSQSRLDREIGIVALCRCSGMQEDEAQAVIQFFDEGINFVYLPPAGALQMILTGASPPPYLFNAYFGRADARQIAAGDPAAKMLLSLLTRHPAQLQVSQSFASNPQSRAYIAGLTYPLNPLLDAAFLRPLLVNPNPWLRACALVNPALEFEEAFAAVTKAPTPGPLDYPALALRPDLTAVQWARLLEAHLLEDLFLFVMLEHPAGQGFDPPALDWADPSREAIRYYSHQTHLGALWRWWNPLLNFPWIQDSIDNINEPGAALAFLLFGAPSEVLDGSPALDDPIARQLIGVHPDVVTRLQASQGQTSAPGSRGMTP